MTRLSPVVAAVLVVLATVGALPVVGLTAGQTATPTPGAGANATAAGSVTLAPGEQLAAVVGVQQAGIEGEVKTRAFGQRVAAAATSTAKASVVRAEVDGLRERLEQLREDRRELRAARRNGTVSDGQYRARLARLHAQIRAVQRELNTTARVAQELPAEALEAKGINATAIRTLQAEAGTLTGPEVAEIARSIAGKAAERGVGPDERGPPDFVTNGSRGPLDGGPDASDSDRGPPGNQSGDRRGPPGNESQGNPGSGGSDGGEDQGRQGPPDDSDAAPDRNSNRGDGSNSDSAGGGNGSDSAGDGASGQGGG